MTADELLSCLTDRPCEVCKFRTFRGCSKWSCVFEDKTEEWIPCSERQPSKDGNYLVCHTICGKTTAVDIAGYAKNLRKVDKYDLPKNKSGWYQYDSEYGYYETDGIVAWMPLPKAYEGRTK